MIFFRFSYNTSTAQSIIFNLSRFASQSAELFEACGFKKKVTSNFIYS